MNPSVFQGYQYQGDNRMSVNKKNIATKMAKELSITISDAHDFLEAFLLKIKDHAKLNVKLSNFGTFSFKLTPKRYGRNPKNLDSYIIPSRNKLNFKPSSKIKENIN